MILPVPVGTPPQTGSQLRFFYRIIWPVIGFYLYNDPFLEVPSPTFTLIQRYEAEGVLPVVHADLYRLSAGDSFDDLLLDEALHDGAALVEWPDRLPGPMLGDALLLRFDIKDGTRFVSVFATPTWARRLPADSLASITQPKAATGMLLAAGKGTRMGAIGTATPKPLVKVAGKPLIAYAIDRLTDIGALPAVVNTHHLSDQMMTYLGNRVEQRDVLISAEQTLLETGGGVKKALDLLDGDSFTVTNTDVIWQDTDTPLISRLKQAFDPDIMDVLLAVAPIERTTGWAPKGDLVLTGQTDRDTVHPCSLRGERLTAPYVYMGTMQTSQKAYQATPDGAFSNLDLFKTAEATGRFFALIHEGTAHHVGTPDGIVAAEEAMGSNPAGWRKR